MHQSDSARCIICGGASKTIDSTGGIFECSLCHHAFAFPQPKPSELEAFCSAPQKYDYWISREAERMQLWKRRLRIILPLAKGTSLLDISTGTGQFLAVAAPCFSNCAGTEISASAIEVARTRYKLELQKQTPDNPVPECGQFDTVTLFHVLEHVNDPSDLLAKCRGRLTTGGKLVVAVPNELLSIRRRALGLIKYALGKLGRERFRRHGRLGIPRICLDGSQEEIHVSFFTNRTLGHLIEHSGFRILTQDLDPSFVNSGLKLAWNVLYYNLLRFLFRTTGINMYDTILMIATPVGQDEASKASNTVLKRAAREKCDEL